MLDIGKKIRDLRESQGMTQEELAHKVGYKSRVSINKIELQRDIPIKKIVPIANALGISPQDLMGWNEPELNNPEQDADLILMDKEIKDYAIKLNSLETSKRKIVMNLIDELLK